MEIRAFRGWRYKPADGDVSAFIAPPYDVLTAEDKSRLLERSPHNIVAVDLPHVPPKQVGPEEVYVRAASLLESWISWGVLVQDDKPAVYVYQQTFQFASRQFTRRAILAEVRASEFGKDVIAHERTFAGPKADRLKLTEHTGVQLSPIFGFFSDPSGLTGRILEQATATPAEQFGTLDGVQQALWAVKDSEPVSSLAIALSAQPVFIADGHHRYTTALNYRDRMSALGKLPPDHGANFVLFALVERDDPGLKILPTHRIFPALGAEFSLESLRNSCGQFEWRRAALNPAIVDDPDAFLSAFGKGAMGFIAPPAEELWIARLKDPNAMASVAADQSRAWRELDVAILHKLIVERAMSPWLADPPSIDYTPSGAEVLRALRTGGGGLGVFLQATSLDEVETIARSGAVMPHKSTYFYPKPATGMVLKSLR